MLLRAYIIRLADGLVAWNSQISVLTDTSVAPGSCLRVQRSVKALVALRNLLVGCVKYFSWQARRGLGGTVF